MQRREGVVLGTGFGLESVVVGVVIQRARRRRERGARRRGHRRDLVPGAERRDERPAHGARRALGTALVRARRVRRLLIGLMRAAEG